MQWGPGRIATVVGAIVVAITLLAGILFGAGEPLTYINSALTVRDVSISLWAFLLPAWWQLDEAWFAPTGNPQALVSFYQAQQKARISWTIAAGVVAILIGSSAPDLQNKGTKQSQTSPSVTNNSQPPR